MKRLIINADDLGADEARNAGIFEAMRAGIVTSASILPNGPGLQDALNRIGSESFKNISWGVHLNLSEGKPVSTGNSLLLGSDGLFKGKSSTQGLLMRQEDRDLETEVVREVEAQISLLKASGIPLHHLDGHQHVHVLPAVLKAMLGSAQRHHIPWIRVPDEPEATSSDFIFPCSLCEESRFFSGLAQRARPVILGAGFHATDQFRGLYLKGRLSIRGLDSVFRRLPDGLTELMVHPGRIAGNLSTTPFSNFSTVEREAELETLLNGRWSLILEEMKIILTPFPEAPY
ncbi:MAG: carbohydrate deacetylase [Thermodesulfobacteriota bacterium]